MLQQRSALGAPMRKSAAQRVVVVKVRSRVCIELLAASAAL